MLAVLRLGLAASLLAASFFVSAAVKVVESKSVDQQRLEAEQEQQNAAMVGLYNQLQHMQEELMLLRGLVEEQGYQLQQLKQQQHDDYLQLDSRIGELSGTELSKIESSADDQEAYQQAYQLIQERKFKEAVTAFESFCQTFPESMMKANALYWLGELYIVDGNEKQARSSFEEIIQQHANNRKYPEAVYKIAIMDLQQGKKDKAQQAIDTVLKQIEDDNSYATFAEKVLAFKNEHFP